LSRRAGASGRLENAVDVMVSDLFKRT